MVSDVKSVTLSGSLTNEGFALCFVEKEGTSIKKKTMRILSEASTPAAKTTTATPAAKTPTAAATTMTTTDALADEWAWEKAN